MENKIKQVCAIQLCLLCAVQLRGQSSDFWGHLLSIKLHLDLLHKFKGELKPYRIFKVKCVYESKGHGKSGCNRGQLFQDLCSFDDNFNVFGVDREDPLSQL
ncbi:hypothetical protein R3I94_008738 [Phoxinus phoxinus]